MTLDRRQCWPAYATDHPEGFDDAFFAQMEHLFSHNWGEGIRPDLQSPSEKDLSFIEWMASYFRHAMGPSRALDVVRWVRETDVRPLLSRVRAPTLLLHRKRCRGYPFSGAERILSALAHARLVALEGEETVRNPSESQLRVRNGASVDEPNEVNGSAKVNG